jgi:hypothetical protein
MSMRGSSGEWGWCVGWVAALALVALTGSASAEDWSVKSVPRADGSGTRCVLESVRQSLSDGYQDTTAQVTVDDRSVVVTSVSNLDASSSDIGLAVDEDPLVRLDRLTGTKTALFETQYGRLVERFKAGSRLRVQLRFWPEWPATGTHSATFNLIGFTKAYGEFAGCR